MAPILFGLDKFFDVMVDWQIYLASPINDLIPGSAADAMYAVGVIEIAAGIAVAAKPRYGAYLVAAWLAGIIVNLLIVSDYYDIALRDFAGAARKPLRPAGPRAPRAGLGSNAQNAGAAARQAAAARSSSHS